MRKRKKHGIYREITPRTRKNALSPQDNAFVPLIYMGDESKGPRAVAAYPEKHPSYFPYADNRSWIVGRVCFQPSLTWLGICQTCVIITMSWVSSGLGLSDTTFIVMPLPFPCDSVLVILCFSWFMTALYLLFLFFLILWGIFTSGWLWRVSSYSNLPPKCWRLEHFHWNRHTHMQLGLRIDHP